MKKFFKEKLINPILDLLKQGITPEKISLSIGFGFILGVFPMIGTTVILCTIATFIFRLNIIAVQIINYLVYPLQFILLIPFIQIGLKIFQVNDFEISLEMIYEIIKTDTPNFFRTFEITQSMKNLTMAYLYGIVAWLFTMPIFIPIFYYTLTPILRKFPIQKD